MRKQSKKKYLLVLGREALDRDSYLYQEILGNLQLGGFEVVFDPMDRIRFAFMRRLGSENMLINRIFLPLFRAMYVVLVQRQWVDFLLFIMKRISSLEFRTRVVAKYIAGIAPHTSHLVVLARSAGSIVISSIANQIAVDHIICLGYPFKHPEDGDAAFRTEHLAWVEKPMMIFQGERDSYGGREVANQYTLSSHIQLSFIDVDHDFLLNESDLLLVKSEIEKVLMSKQ
ncbi:alpha/beta family hydrolase [Aquirufa nivalisilvae]